LKTLTNNFFTKKEYKMPTQKSLKDKITNILGIVVAVGTVVVTALGSIPTDSQWYVWAGAALFALFGWFTGKSGDLKGSN